MTKQFHFLLTASAMLACASPAIAQDIRIKVDNLKNDPASTDQANGSHSGSAQPRIIWRTPEVRPFTWEEQRVFDRSSQRFWIIPENE